jgi:hypothetical protein
MQNKIGETPLRMAVKTQNAEIIELLQLKSTKTVKNINVGTRGGTSGGTRYRIKKYKKRNSKKKHYNDTT